MAALTRIESFGQRGEGIADVEGRRVFVPFTLPGDIAEVEAEGDRGTLVELVEPGPDRIEPFCPYFTRCGSCQLQHVGPDTYAAFKHGLVEDVLRHGGIDAPVLPMLDARGNGRRRATLHATAGGAGYMRARSHELLSIATCPILVPALREGAPMIARAVGGLIGESDVPHRNCGLVDADKSDKRSLKPDKRSAVQRFNSAVVQRRTIVQSRPPTCRWAAPMSSCRRHLQATAAAEHASRGWCSTSARRNRWPTSFGVGLLALRMAEQANAAFGTGRSWSAAPCASRS